MVCACDYRCPQRSEATDTPGPGITGSYETSGFENQKHYAILTTKTSRSSPCFSVVYLTVSTTFKQKDTTDKCINCRNRKVILH